MLSAHLFLILLSPFLVFGESSTEFPEEWNDWALHTSSSTYHEVSNQYPKRLCVFSPFCLSVCGLLCPFAFLSFLFCLCFCSLESASGQRMSTFSTMNSLRTAPTQTSIV